MYLSFVYLRNGDKRAAAETFGCAEGQRAQHVRAPTTSLGSRPLPQTRKFARNTEPAGCELRSTGGGREGCTQHPRREMAVERDAKVNNPHATVGCLMRGEGGHDFAKGFEWSEEKGDGESLPDGPEIPAISRGPFGTAYRCRRL